MLTKSDLAALRQCHRRLWLEQHAPGVAAPGDATSWRRARDGNIVGAKARELLGPEVLWPPHHDDPVVAAAQALQLLQAAPHVPAVEVPLVRDGLYARADALVPAEAGYALQETKSSTFPLKADGVTPGRPDEHLLDDLAIQLWVTETSPLPLVRAELNLLDNRWRYPGGDDYRGLFRQWVADASIHERVALVPQWLAQARVVLEGAMPAVTTGAQCMKPHPCPFFAHCRALDPPAPAHPIELLPGSAGKSLARKLRERRGYTSLLDPRPAELTGKEAGLYRRMQRAHASGQAVLEADSGAALATLPWPRFYFDFEGIDLPVPQWAGVRPYEHVPFQWSCHIENENGAFTHREFLDLSGDDPSLRCIEALLQAIAPEGDGPIFVYSKTYEEGRLRELGERHPQHAAALQRLIDRLVDLLPLVRAGYYHPAMRGSFSIKKVLATIAPELDHAGLDGVADGGSAGVAYLHAVFESGMTTERREQYRRELLAYCERDTWAMVEVAWFLERRGRPVAGG